VSTVDLEEMTFPETDSGNAERLAAMFGSDFRWVRDEQRFYKWNGTLWISDRTGDTLLPFTKAVARAIPDEKFAKSSESANRRSSMIRLIKGEPSVQADRELFDARPWLLNVQNGTLDLEAGMLREFDREDYLTKQASVVWDPRAKAPKFDALLDFVFCGDKDLIHFAVKALGLTLTGITSEQCFFLCHGLGSNGKTTFLEVAGGILGQDYATMANGGTLLESKFSSSDSGYDIATYAGKRMVTAAEPKKSGHLDEELLKRLTGGERVKARQIFGEPFEFRPECKLWLAMNKKPRIIGTDDGIWRRVLLVPFLAHMAKDDPRRVPDLHKVLLAEEGPGILTRMVEGLGAWQQEGLNPPAAVRNATAEYRSSQDATGDFFTAKCITGSKYKVAAGELYEAYVKWADAANVFVLRANEFGEECDRRGFVSKRGDTGFVRRGLSLKEDPQMLAVFEEGP